MKKSGVTTQQAEAWFDELGSTRPAPLPQDSKAYPVTGIFVTTQDNGVILRVVLPGGNTVNLFANAVAAVGLRQAIRAAGKDGGWLDDDDAIIVQESQGNGRWRPRA